jgi:hypothetical protein
MEKKLHCLICHKEGEEEYEEVGGGGRRGGVKWQEEQE